MCDENLYTLLEDADLQDMGDMFQSLNQTDKEFLRKKMMQKILENTKKYNAEQRLKKLLEKSSEDFWGI